MPRRTPGRTVGAEDNMRRNLSTWLERNERTVGWLATKTTMPYSALYKSLRYDRFFNVDEAIQIAAATGMTLEEMVAK